MKMSGKAYDWGIYYDKKSDTLSIRPKVVKPATSVDCDGKFWLRVDVQTKEVVGIEIENFSNFSKTVKR